ncbi:ISL3 family transposase [Nonomuraea harbinensis]|uniref:ISL3 family transposase n=1 Tax=Nonomuraea harbinensis TaxID=1286938 RepID=UPI0027E34E0D|nr:ISL3 family transposase [Nonomuraea harbinensis]
MLISARSRNTEAPCGSCGTLSRRVHSRYRRQLQDLPCGEVPVTVELEMRRWFCVNSDCLVRTFAEQVPELAQPYARRTSALRRLLEHIALALAGRAGARLAARLGITVSRSLLIRLIRALPDPETRQVRILGVDDFAKRKGHSYATILIDVESGDPIDVLENRLAGTLADWLRRHPSVEIICRDRAGAYAEGAADGAPQATQVADRWHLWKNLCDAVEATVRIHRADLREPSPDSTTPTASESSTGSAPPIPDSLPESRTAVRTRERHAAIHDLLAQGKTHTEICKILGLSDKTVRKFRRAATADQAFSGPRASLKQIERFAPYLLQRWNQGIHDGVVLHAEIVAQGYQGSSRSVRRYLQPLRAGLTPPQLPPPPPKVREVTRWITSHPDHLTEHDSANLAQVKMRSPALERLSAHVAAFAEMLTGRHGARLEDWLTAVEDDGLSHLHAFAHGIRRDHAAVLAGLTLPHSSGPVEGNVCRVIMWNLICQAWHSARQRGYRLAGAAMNLDNYLS